MPKSSYFYHRAALSLPDKYAGLRERVRAAFKEANGRYGYRRLHVVLTKDGGTVSEKVVRRLMHDENLVVFCRKKRKYNAYMGEISPPVPNVIERDFHADAPNTKWLTDLTEFGLPTGKVYLSPVIDCFDGMAVSWSIGTSPNADMANSMLDDAISTLDQDERPVVHSDRGSHYRWPGWIARMESAGLVRSMSRKGCSPDNAACEGFFGRVKNEMFYGYILRF
jgi:putative transposase